LENLIDYLIPLLVILFFLSFKAKRKKAKGERAKGETPDKTKKEGLGLFGKINKMLEEYAESDQKGAPPGKSDVSEDWEHDPWEVNPKYAEAAPETVQGEEKNPEMAVMGKQSDQISEPVAVRPVLPKPDASEYLPKKVSKLDLRKAVIWSEILGPPIALKDE